MELMLASFFVFLVLASLDRYSAAGLGSATVSTTNFTPIFC